MPNDSQPAPGKAAEWTARTWSSRDGLQLYYRDYPGSDDRPPLLCLHGLTRNSRDFEDFAERYAGRFRVIAVDFRGRGMSERDPEPDTAGLDRIKSYVGKPKRFKDWAEAADYVVEVNRGLPVSNGPDDWVR